MNSKNLMKVLKESLNMQEELYGLVIECFNEIFDKDNRLMIINCFEDDYENIHLNGCLQSLAYYQNQLERRRKERAEMIELDKKIKDK